MKLKTDILKINDKKYEVLDDDRTIFDKDFNFIPINALENQFVYSFGGHWYIQEGDEVTMQPFKTNW